MSAFVCLPVCVCVYACECVREVGLCFLRFRIHNDGSTRHRPSPLLLNPQPCYGRNFINPSLQPSIKISFFSTFLPLLCGVA